MMKGKFIYKDFSDTKYEGELYTVKLSKTLAVIPKYGIYYPQEFGYTEDPPTGAHGATGGVYGIAKTVQPNEIILIRQFLVSEGFAIERDDVKKDAIELNDRGRILKECGSIIAYDRWLYHQKSEDLFRTKMVENSYWISVSIAISTGIAAVYYVSQLYDSRPFLTKVCLAAAAAIAILLLGLRYLKRK